MTIKKTKIQKKKTNTKKVKKRAAASKATKAKTSKNKPKTTKKAIKPGAKSKKVTTKVKAKAVKAKAGTTKKKAAIKKTVKTKAVKAKKPGKTKAAKATATKKKTTKVTLKVTSKAKSAKAKAGTTKKKAANSILTKVATTKTTSRRKLSSPSYQELVGESKYYVGEASQPLYQESDFNFPETYQEDKIILLVRDPYWMYACWDITAQKVEEIRNHLGEARFSSAKLILRIMDVTNTGSDSPNSCFDIEIPSANNWYINVPNSDVSYCVDIGYLTEDSEFILLARSNTVSTPRSAAAEMYAEEEEMTPEEYDQIYALSGGLNVGLSSGELNKVMREKLAQELSSGQVSSLAASEFMHKKQKKEREFFLVVNTELIVYGATVPSAKLNIQGKQKKLNPDGTFSARFALPKGKQVIPVNATSQDEIDSITITPVVEKNTE